MDCCECNTHTQVNHTWHVGHAPHHGVPVWLCVRHCCALWDSPKKQSRRQNITCHVLGRQWGYCWSLANGQQLPSTKRTGRCCCLAPPPLPLRNAASESALAVSKSIPQSTSETMGIIWARVCLLVKTAFAVFCREQLYMFMTQFPRHLGKCRNGR